MFQCVHGVRSVVMVFVPCLIFTGNQVMGFVFLSVDHFTVHVQKPTVCCCADWWNYIVMEGFKSEGKVLC